MISVTKCFLIFILIKTTFCVNILHVAHIPSPSHHIWNRALAFALAEKGYNVTMLTHDEEKVKPKNFHLILLEGIYQQPFTDFPLDEVVKHTPISGIQAMFTWPYFFCQHDLGTKGLKTLLNYPKDFKFDLIIFDVTLGQCLYPIIERFNNPPVIGTTPFLLPAYISHAFGNPLQSAYSPFNSSPFSDRMSFKERLLNFIYTYGEVLYRKYIAIPDETKLAKQYFGENIRPFEEVERNISLLLSNYDPILLYPIDLPPNIIPCGGIQIKPPKPLPKDLQEIVDKAKDGVILFSLGSNLRSDSLSPTKRKIILETFAKLPQTVLWKFETDNLEGLPKNVIIRKWLPQNDILGHPKTKLFINHGGGLGTQETLYHGVPVVGFPFFLDHVGNLARLEHRKMGKTVDYANLTFEKFYGAVTEVLNNPIYSENIKKLSKKYRDQPQTALERGVFWVEHVLRHGDGEHLVTAARDMPFYQTMNLDILAVAVLAVILVYSVILFVFTILRFLLGIIWRR